MTLPAPNLDDRGFQDLVDEAKRLVQLRNPEWTDHNVSDPGVTLIETFAYLTDQLIYRLNRVPELHYIKFLDLLGESMIPPAAAVTPIEFHLSVPQAQDIMIPRGTMVSTARTASERPITFSTSEDLNIVTTQAEHVLTKTVDDPINNHDDARAVGVEFPVFSTVPVPGDAMYIGLSQPASHCFVRITIVQDAQMEGIGIDPLRPPLAVEAWNGENWAMAPVLSDETGGLNRRGALEVFISAHAPSIMGGITASWLRIRVTEVHGDQPAYSRTPEILGVQVETTGGLVAGAHSEPIENDVIGPCSGTPGDRMFVSNAPLVSGQGDLVIEVSTSQGWETWHRVESFADSGPLDRHFHLDDVSGELRFGPLIRLADGGVRSYGATPETGAMVRIPRYLTGGGISGNVDAHTLSVLRSSIPFVSRVDNPHAATGGMDAETLDDVKERAAITVRTQMRAVTARDYELLTQLAAPSIARVACLDAAELDRPGHVLIQVVPRVPLDVSDFELLQPREETLRQIRDYLDARRPLGSVLHIEPPKYLGASVAARIALEPGAQRAKVIAEADQALRLYMHPTAGGYAGTGWPFGRPLLLGDVHAVLQRVPGLAYVDAVRLLPVDIVNGVRGEPSEKVQPGPQELIFCVGNDIEVI